jgi:hypothetical protein
MAVILINLQQPRGETNHTIVLGVLCRLSGYCDDFEHIGEFSKLEYQAGSL